MQAALAAASQPQGQGGSASGGAQSGAEALSESMLGRFDAEAQVAAWQKRQAILDVMSVVRSETATMGVKTRGGKRNNSVLRSRAHGEFRDWQSVCLLTTYYLLLTTHYILLNTYHLLLTTYY